MKLQLVIYIQCVKKNGGKGYTDSVVLGFSRLRPFSKSRNNRSKNNNCTVINCNLTVNIKLCKRKLTLFLSNYSLQLETLGAFKIVIFRSTSLKNWVYYIEICTYILKMVSILKIRLQRNL